jgi:exopolysaccharide production protein ExoZ
MIIAGAASLEGRMPTIRLLRLLGDASYSTYLTHGVIIGLAGKLWAKAPVEGWTQFIGWVACCLLASAIVGVVVHKYLEKPMLKWLRDYCKSDVLTTSKVALQ